ncbi:MAG TPA: hypothetical protein VM802_15130 [Chitinophaga sp.]|uniref:hypothetical protein n=1 Tax=Chitinophaga sp. TaxID=1869181 RepID=UPI002CBA957B|nr:hypothetical protein [Chitinophaga sp.]HVI46207.1 hypothetical protein [Chitinophaga sp.]
MKTFLLVLCLFNTVNCIDATTVYICDNKNVRKYHYRADCRGLSNCQYKIISTTLEKAIRSKKTLCHWEQRSLN